MRSSKRPAGSSSVGVGVSCDWGWLLGFWAVGWASACRNSWALRVESCACKRLACNWVDPLRNEVMNSRSASNQRGRRHGGRWQTIAPGGVKEKRMPRWSPGRPSTKDVVVVQPINACVAYQRSRRDAPSRDVSVCVKPRHGAGCRWRQVSVRVAEVVMIAKSVAPTKRLDLGFGQGIASYCVSMQLKSPPISTVRPSVGRMACRWDAKAWRSWPWQGAYTLMMLYRMPCRSKSTRRSRPSGFAKGNRWGDVIDEESLIRMATPLVAILLRAGVGVAGTRDWWVWRPMSAGGCELWDMKCVVVGSVPEEESLSWETLSLCPSRC